MLYHEENLDAHASTSVPPPAVGTHLFYGQGGTGAPPAYPSGTVATATNVAALSTAHISTAVELGGAEGWGALPAHLAGMDSLGSQFAQGLAHHPHGVESSRSSLGACPVAFPPPTMPRSNWTSTWQQHATAPPPPPPPPLDTTQCAMLESTVIISPGGPHPEALDAERWSSGESSKWSNITSLMPGHMRKAPSRRATDLSFGGRCVETQPFSILSFPGDCSSDWRQMFELDEAALEDRCKLSSACVFFRDDDTQLAGKHSSPCQCQRLYEGYHASYNTWPDGRAPFGCLWFTRWLANAEEALRLHQVAVVVYKHGLVGKDVGLGPSQAAEVRKLQDMGEDFISVDIDDFKGHILPLARQGPTDRRTPEKKRRLLELLKASHPTGNARSSRSSLGSRPVPQPLDEDQISEASVLPSPIAGGFFTPAQFRDGSASISAVTAAASPMPSPAVSEMHSIWQEEAPTLSPLASPAMSEMHSIWHNGGDEEAANSEDGASKIPTGSSGRARLGSKLSSSGRPKKGSNVPPRTMAASGTASATISEDVTGIAAFSIGSRNVSSLSPIKASGSHLGLSDVASASLSSSARLRKASLLNTGSAPVKLLIIQAQGFRPRLGGQPREAYCRVEVRNRPSSRVQTKPVFSLTPFWNHEVYLRDYNLGEEILFTILDKEVLQQDSVLGKALLTSSMLGTAGYDGAVPLFDTGSSGEAYLTIKATFVADHLEVPASPLARANPEQLEEQRHAPPHLAASILIPASSEKGQSSPKSPSKEVRFSAIPTIEEIASDGDDGELWDGGVGGDVNGGAGDGTGLYQVDLTDLDDF
mmetsp:Transcript_7282/g.15924  ORF Transcript_7282/g.15924 Transcript_7282/m.15924 type:complete len:817 (-) Transcript_7282:400-2850(-)